MLLKNKFFLRWVKTLWEKEKNVSFADDKIKVNQNLKSGLGKVENIVGNVTSIFSVSHNVFKSFLSFFSFFLSKAFFLKVIKSLDCVVKESTLYHKILTFNDPERKSLLKTLWKKEKMLVTSIFFFFPTMFSTFPKSNFNF